MQAVEAWWAHSRAFVRLRPASQKRAVPDPAGRLARKRIADLPPEIGRTLDARGAPFRIGRWIAWAPGKCGPARDERCLRRYNAAVQFRDQHGRWPTDIECNRLDPPTTPRRARCAPGGDAVPAQSGPAGSTADASAGGSEVQSGLSEEGLRELFVLRGTPLDQAEWLLEAIRMSGIPIIARAATSRPEPEGGADQ
jgi:hypothetical protein